MAAGMNQFVAWLNGKLREFNTDEGIFGSYITGILEGDETSDEKTEALEGILAEIIESDCSAFITEILDRWKQCHQEESAAESAGPKLKLDVDEQLAKLLENQKLATKVEREYTEEERRIKQQILSQYSQLSEDEAEDDDDDEGSGAAGGGGGGGPSSDGLLQRNTNFADVQALVREKREQARLESAQKKEKDKQDREKQKQLREEKKEKRKTVKGERRR